LRRGSGLIRLFGRVATGAHISASKFSGWPVLSATYQVASPSRLPFRVVELDGGRCSSKTPRPAILLQLTLFRPVRPNIIVGEQRGARQALAGRHVMIDVTTRRRLHVSSGGTAGPYIIVPLTQLDPVRRLLDSHEVRYSVDENAISIDGKPEIVVIDLGFGSDAVRIQAILDANP
jgi:hypothetical protein